MRSWCKNRQPSGTSRASLTNSPAGVRGYQSETFPQTLAPPSSESRHFILRHFSAPLRTQNVQIPNVSLSPGPRISPREYPHFCSPPPVYNSRRQRKGTTWWWGWAQRPPRAPPHQRSMGMACVACSTRAICSSGYIWGHRVGAINPQPHPCQSCLPTGLVPFQGSSDHPRFCFSLKSVLEISASRPPATPPVAPVQKPRQPPRNLIPVNPSLFWSLLSPPPTGLVLP